MDQGPDSDDDLLERIAQSDQGAFRRLVQRHADRAYGVALRILRNASDAEDVVQDTLLKVWTHRGRWTSGKAKFSTWLYRVVTNRCIDLRRLPRTEDMERAPDMPDASPDALDRMQQNAITDMLEAAMNRLPDQQRIALIFSYHENMSNAEIAEVLETTVTAVESLLKRGRQQLREILAEVRGDILQSFRDR